MNFLKTNVLAAFALASGLAGQACKRTTKITGASTHTSATVSILGRVEKGPFVKGSAITITPLDATLAPAGRAYSAETTSDAGDYAYDGRFEAHLAEISATGSFFDEVTGKISDTPATLVAYADLSAAPRVNVNVLTTLAAPRIKRLVADGHAFAAAAAQAHDEILAAFHIKPDGVGAFAEMSIARGGDDNAILLAISALLHADFADFAADLADGVLDGHAALFIDRAQKIDLDGVRANVKNYYAALGVSAEIPYFDDFVMSDGQHLNRDVETQIALLDLPGEMHNATRADFKVALVGKRLEGTEVRLHFLGIIAPPLGLDPGALLFEDTAYRTPRVVTVHANEHDVQNSAQLQASADALESVFAGIGYVDDAATLSVGADLTRTWVGGMAMGPGGDVFVTDHGNYQVLKVSASGEITALVSTAVHPTLIAVDAAGNYYVEDLKTNKPRITFTDPHNSANNYAVSPDVSGHGAAAYAMGIDPGTNTPCAVVPTDASRPGAMTLVRISKTPQTIYTDFTTDATAISGVAIAGSAAYVAGSFDGDATVVTRVDLSLNGGVTPFVTRAMLTNAGLHDAGITAISYDNHKALFYLGTSVGVVSVNAAATEVRVYCGLAIGASAAAGRCGQAAIGPAGVTMLMPGVAPDAGLYFWDSQHIVKVTPPAR